jgi:hypothetical protein
MSSAWQFISSATVPGTSAAIKASNSYFSVMEDDLKHCAGFMPVDPSECRQHALDCVRLAQTGRGFIFLEHYNPD